jgi:hypothetical protein
MLSQLRTNFVRMNISYILCWQSGKGQIVVSYILHSTIRKRKIATYLLYWALYVGLLLSRVHVLTPINIRFGSDARLVVCHTTAPQLDSISIILFEDVLAVLLFVVLTLMTTVYWYLVGWLMCHMTGLFYFTSVATHTHTHENIGSYIFIGPKNYYPININLVKK